MKQLSIIILLLTFFYGCATPYQPVGLAGGYSETQLDKNVFTITFNGNSDTSVERASDFALLRSAELALQNGYKYFIIIDANSYHSIVAGQAFIVSLPSASNTIVCFKEKPTNSFSYNAEFI